MMVAGKILETIGSVLIAYVGLRAMILEVSIGRFLAQRNSDRPNPATDPDQIERLRERLEAIFERRKRQFGFYEAIAVGFGTLLVAVGCAVYLIGLLKSGH